MLYNEGAKTREVECVKIYLDSYIAASFWLHLLCLCLTSTLIKNRSRKIKRRRLVCAALCCAGMDAGTVVLVSCFGGIRNELLVFLSAITGLVLGTFLSFGKRYVVRNGILLFTVTAFLSGIFQVMRVKNIGLFCMVGTLLLPLLREGVTTLFRSKQTDASVYEVTLYKQETKQSLSALMDTGNRLRLFGSRIPVVLVDECYLTEWIKEAEQKTPQKLVFIPYKGVVGKGLLHGIRLNCGFRKEGGELCYGEVAAVAAEHKLFYGCGYQMILQPEVLTMDCVKDTQEGEGNVI